MTRVVTKLASDSSKLLAYRRPGSSVDNDIYSYGSDGRISSIVHDGATWTYSWTTGNQRLTATVTDPAGHQETTVTDTNLNFVISHTDALGRQTNYLSDLSGRPTSVTQPEGNQTILSYDGRGNVTRTERRSKVPNSPVIATTAVYPASCANPFSCNKPISTTDAKGNVTNYTYDATHGGVLTVTGPPVGGVSPQVRYTYSQLQASYLNSSGAVVQSGIPEYRLTSISSCKTGASCSGTANEARTTIAYGPASGANNLLPTSMTVASGDGAIASTTATSYDKRGNVAAVDGPIPGTADTTRYVYDADDRPTGVILPDPDGTGPRRNRGIDIHYDAGGRIDQQQTGTVNADGSGFSGLQQQAFTYDVAGRKTSERLKTGSSVWNVAQYSYDVLGRLQCSALRTNPDAWASLPGNACTLQATGAAGPDRLTRYEYFDDSRLKSTTSGYQTAAAATENVTYTPNGQVATNSDANGNVTAFDYDGYDRLLKTRFPNTSGGGSSTTDYIQVGYDNNGNVVSRTLRGNPGAVTSITYDALDRTSHITQPGGSWADPAIDLAYDNLGHLTSATSGNGHGYSAAFDALGRKTSDGDAVSARTMQYDAAGRRTRLTWSDGFYVTYDYDASSEVTAIRENGGGVLASFSYDDLGRRTGLTRGNGVTTSYGYDGASRLTALTNDLAGTARDLSLTFGFNPANQITARTASNDAYAFTQGYNVSRPYAVNGLNQYTAIGPLVPSYDGKGNLTQAGSVSYGYSMTNQLVTASAPDKRLIYGPGGLLENVMDAPGAGSANAGFQRLDGQIVDEVSGAGGTAIQRRYVFGPAGDEPLVWYEGSGTGDRRYLVADERGSVVAVTDGAGAALAVNSYDDYGIPGSNNLGLFQYTGQAWLSALGLYDYKARIYSPTLGRFLQTDPIGYAGGMHLYNYVGSDPVNAIDPTGLQAQPAVQQEFELPRIDVYMPIDEPSFCSQYPLNPGCFWTSSDLFNSRAGLFDRPGIFRGLPAYGAPPQNNQPTCPGNKSIFASIAEGADTVGDVADGVAIGSATLGLITAPTGAGGAFFGGTALVAGVVGRVASGVSIVANLADGNYGGAGAGAAGLVGGHVAGRIVGGVATSAYARNRMFGNLSAGQQRRVDLFSDTGTSAGSRVASRAVCR